MKRMFLTVFLFFACSAQATDIGERKGFSILPEVINNAPPVLRFFSFWCPSCYIQDEVINITAEVKKNLPGNIKLTEYHVSFMGPLGKEMTKAWSVAILLNATERVKPALFDAVLKKQSINSESDIRNIFIGAGISGDEYDAALNSFAVKALTEKQLQLANAVGLRAVPAMFINGKYQIDPKGLDKSSTASFIKDYADTVHFLLTK